MINVSAHFYELRPMTERTLNLRGLKCPRDIENIVNAILGEIVKALGRWDRVELGGESASPTVRNAQT
jgi:hypothetical protein